MRRLMHEIKARSPQAGFVLWTNGTAFGGFAPAAVDECLQHPYPFAIEDLKVFDQIVISNYHGRDLSALFAADLSSHIVVLDPQLDQRRHPKRKLTLQRCLVPYKELIFDAWGRAHMCCYDWRAEIEIGSLQEQPFGEILARWSELRKRITAPLKPGAPSICLCCPFSTPLVARLIPELARQIEAEDQAEQQPSAAERPVVVGVAYRIPEKRVREHIEWNDALYREFGIALYLVVESLYEGLPGYVRQLVFPEPLKVFNLARTKNYGIAAAIFDGADLVVSTDIDIAFDHAVLKRMIHSRPDEAIVPIYVMAQTFEARQETRDCAPGATGTISMWAEAWRYLSYDERCEGYGAEDGIMIQDIREAGLRIDRWHGHPIYHIAHRPGTCQIEHAGRNDHWNEKFNPYNLAANREYLEERLQEEAEPCE